MKKRKADCQAAERKAERENESSQAKWNGKAKDGKQKGGTESGGGTRDRSNKAEGKGEARKRIE